MNAFQRCGLAVACCFAIVAARPGECAAQSAEAGVDGKGIVGGALAGAETVMLLEAAFGVNPSWAYLVGGAAGAGGGGVAGYYLEKGAASEPPTFLLAGGIALIVPTMIVVMNATTYQPPEALQHDAGRAAREAGLSLPAFAVKSAFTRADQHVFGVDHATEYHLSFLRGAF